MSCPSCIQHVNEALTMQGVATIAVQLHRGVVAAEHHAGVSVERLIGALRSAGYEPRRGRHRDQPGNG